MLRFSEELMLLRCVTAVLQDSEGSMSIFTLCSIMNHCRRHRCLWHTGTNLHVWPPASKNPLSSMWDGDRRSFWAESGVRSPRPGQGLWGWPALCTTGLDSAEAAALWTGRRLQCHTFSSWRPKLSAVFNQPDTPFSSRQLKTSGLSTHRHVEQGEWTVVPTGWLLGRGHHGECFLRRLFASRGVDNPGTGNPALRVSALGESLNYATLYFWCLHYIYNFISQN